MKLLVRLVAVAAALIALLLTRSCRTGEPSPRGDVGRGGEVDVAGLGFFHGDAEAPLQVVEFTDPACPYCADFHSDARDSLFRAFVATGQARWITIPWVSGQYPNSRPAVVAIECADTPDLAESVTEELYLGRDAWVSAGRAAQHSLVREIALRAGLDRAAYDDCVSDDALATRIDRADSLAAALGIRGTPTYLIDGFPMMGAVPFAFARRAFDERLAESALPDSLR